MSKFIIIEGTDNVGKDTQQDLIIKNMSDHVFHKLHYSSLPICSFSMLIKHMIHMKYVELHIA